MALFKSFTFDGINSLDHGIYITGSAVYDAPERAVEMITVPGRSGAIVLDQGRFENIEVTYKAGCFGAKQADFADKVRLFRNALASRYNYKVLTDEYNPDEYRLGLYKSGLSVDPVQYGRAGEFDIVFECKPQRWLVSGTTAINVTSGDELVNPTEFDSQPLIVFDGTGTLGIGEYILTITGSASQRLYVDCDSMEIYTNNGGILTNASSLVSINKADFPVLKPGINGVTYSGLANVNITPRWWQI